MTTNGKPVEAEAGEGDGREDWIDGLPPAAPEEDLRRRAALMTFLLEAEVVEGSKGGAGGRIGWRHDGEVEPIGGTVGALALDAFGFFDVYVHDRFEEEVDGEAARIAAWAVHADVLASLLAQLGAPVRRFRDGPDAAERRAAGEWSKLPGHVADMLYKTVVGYEIVEREGGPHDLVATRHPFGDRPQACAAKTLTTLVRRGLVERRPRPDFDRWRISKKGRILYAAENRWRDFIDRETEARAASGKPAGGPAAQSPDAADRGAPRS